MNVKEMIAWLQTQDQEAIVEVVVHSRGSGYCDQGGNATVEEFTDELGEWAIPKHYEYDKYWKDKSGSDPLYAKYYGKTFLLLGVINE